MSLDPSTLKRGDRVIFNRRVIGELRHRITNDSEYTDETRYYFVDGYGDKFWMEGDDSLWETAVLINETLTRKIQAEIDALEAADVENIQ